MAPAATCSSKSGQVYASSYDAWGNVTSRTYSGTIATLTYDLLDHFVSWNAGTNNKELYVYDASGTRVLRRTTNSSGTTMTVYAFGLEEHNYYNAGGHRADLYYYSLGGRLLGARDNNGKTTFYLTDALGSVLASFNNVASSAAIKGNQVYGPYGNPRDFQGTINTAKGFTGQYNDSLTGLDYYNSRYYDQVAGVFLSADVKQGNMQGMDPYGYVGGNPETRNDPTGQMFINPTSGGGGGPITIPCSCAQDPQPVPAPVALGGAGPYLPNEPGWHQIGGIVQAYGYQFGNLIVSESVDEAFRLRRFFWPDDGGVSLNQLIAYQLAVTAQEWRSEFMKGPGKPFGFPKSNNVGNGFYYVTDANGNLVTKGVQDPINGTNSKDPSEPVGYNHSEQRLIRDFNGTISGLQANGQLQAGSTLHYVLFTQFYPCGISCSSKTFAQAKQAMQKLAGPGVNIDFSVWTSAQNAGIPVISATQVTQYYP